MNGLSFVTLGLLIVVVPGALFNNLQNSNLTVSQTQTLTCSADPNYPTCQISGNAGCQGPGTPCQLSGASISFLSTSSPFTSLLRGDISGFISGLKSTSAATTVNVWQTIGLPITNYISADCYFGYRGPNTYQVIKCTQSNQNNNANLSKSQAAIWATTIGNGSTVPFYRLGVTNSTYPYIQYESSACIYEFTIYHGAKLLVIYFGCQYYQTYGGNTNYWYYWAAVNGTAWTSANAGCWSANSCANNTNHHFPAQVQLMNSRTYECANAYSSPGGVAANTATPVAPNHKDPLAIPPVWPECQNAINNAYAVLGQQNASNQSLGGFAIIMAFLGGLLFLILGLGLGFQVGGSILGTGTTFGFSTNRQGTKFCMVLGIGLLMWSFFYGSFSFWFTSGYLPYGLDGPFGFISVLTSSLVFFGVYKQATDN